MDERFNVIEREMLEKGIWKDSCPVQVTQLSLVQVPYKNFEGENKTGEILVLKDLKENVINIFRKLLEIDFRIHSIKLINEFDGDDDQSMAANNTSCFNCRYIAGTNKYSKHAYGVAIDINPVQNPFISKSGAVSPEEGKEFVERSNIRTGMITPEVVKIFSENRFSVWGGEWESIKDYHHFELSDEDINLLLKDKF